MRGTEEGSLCTTERERRGQLEVHLRGRMNSSLIARRLLKVSLVSMSVFKEIRSRRIKWAGHVTHVVEKRHSWKVLFFKPE